MNYTQNILIVDDTPENLFILERVLRRLPAHIIRASSGQEALIAALNNNLALAILDVQMPEMDGYELASLLREHDDFRTLPIIFVSAVYSDEHHVFKGYEAGAVDFIVKPFDASQLLSKVKVFLALQKTHLELQQKVEELALSESRFQTLVKTIPDIVFRIDVQGTFVFINNAVRILGYTPEELLHKQYEILIHPEDIQNNSYLCNTKREGSKKIISREQLADTKRVEKIELRLLSKPDINEATKETHDEFTYHGHHILYTEASCSDIYHVLPSGEGYQFLGTVGVLRDITDRKKTEKELILYREHLENLVEERTKKLKEEIDERQKSEQKRRQLESMLMQQQRLESIGTLAGGVAHEINNPINGIMNYAQLIVDAGAEGATSDFAEAIIEETTRVSKIVRNLLQFARADKGMGMEEASPQDMIEYVVSLVKTIMRHDQIALLLEEPVQPIPSVTCRKNEIEQVIMNLLTNACDALNTRYTGYDENKTVKISISTGSLDGKPSVLWTVEDHGTGIPEDVLPFIFDPFFTTKDRTKGTGLGLSISHGIVMDHNGDLRVESNPGEYTRFTLELPTEQS